MKSTALKWPSFHSSMQFSIWCYDAISVNKNLCYRTRVHTAVRTSVIVRRGMGFKYMEGHSFIMGVCKQLHTQHVRNAWCLKQSSASSWVLCSGQHDAVVVMGTYTIYKSILGDKLVNKCHLCLGIAYSVARCQAILECSGQPGMPLDFPMNLAAMLLHLCVWGAY